MDVLFIGPIDSVMLQCQANDTIREVAAKVEEEAGWQDFDFVVAGDLVNGRSGKQFFGLPISAGAEVEVVINKECSAKRMLHKLGVEPVPSSYLTTVEHGTWECLHNAGVEPDERDVVLAVCRMGTLSSEQKVANVKFLVDRLQFNLNKKQNGYTLLRELLDMPSELLRGLMLLGADINTMCASTCNILHSCVNRADHELLSKVLSLGITPDLPDHKGVSALVVACSLGDEVAEAILITAGADENFLCPSRDTPLRAKERYQTTMGAIGDDNLRLF